MHHAEAAGRLSAHELQNARLGLWLFIVSEAALFSACLLYTSDAADE